MTSTAVTRNNKVINAFNNNVTVTGDTINSTIKNKFDFKGCKGVKAIGSINNSYNNKLTFSGKTSKSEIITTFKY